jgi:hypothetical protein
MVSVDTRVRAIESWAHREYDSAAGLGPPNPLLDSILRKLDGNERSQFS